MYESIDCAPNVFLMCSLKVTIETIFFEHVQSLLAQHSLSLSLFLSIHLRYKSLETTLTTFEQHVRSLLALTLSLSLSLSLSHTHTHIRFTIQVRDYF
jgi:hypothetical protein